MIGFAGVLHVFAIALAGLAPLALAGEWDITAGLGVRETYTDNAGLAEDNGDRETDFITNVMPSLSVRGTGARASLNLDFNHDQLFFANDEGRNHSSNTLSASGRAELWEKVVFIDGTASLSRQVVDSRRASSNSDAGQSINRSKVRSFDVSPYFLHHLGTWVETETRIRYGVVTNDAASVSNNTTRAEFFRASSGRRFTQMLWSGTVNRVKEAKSGATPTRRSLNADSEFTFIVNRNWGLIGGAGYEDIEDGTLNRQPKGLTWKAGLSITPGPRSSLRATYGRRFKESNISVDLSHRLSARTRFTATFVETQQTSQQQINQDLSFLTTDADGTLIDERTGLPFVAGDSNFGFQSSTFRQRRFNAVLSGERRRNTFSLGATWESRKTDLTGIDETVISGNAAVGRRLTRRTTVNLSASYRNTDFGDAAGRIDNFFTVQGDLSYRIFKSANAVLTYTRTQRRSNADGNGLTENAVVLGLRQEF